jgi:hypothetical protein
MTILYQELPYRVQHLFSTGFGEFRQAAQRLLCQIDELNDHELATQSWGSLRNSLGRLWDGFQQVCQTTAG